MGKKRGWIRDIKEVNLLGPEDMGFSSKITSEMNRKSGDILFTHLERKEERNEGRKEGK